MLNSIESILKFLDGKKMVICSVAALILTFLTQTGVIDAALSDLILKILVILAGGTAAATPTVLGNRNSMGARVKV